MNVKFLLAAALLLMVAACSPAISPTSTAAPGGGTVGPAAEANFRMLISDDRNAIGDFSSVIVTISRIGIHRSGSGVQGGGEWLEFPPHLLTVDLTKLQGAQAMEIWEGTVPPGTYDKVFIYVDAVEGTLKAGGAKVSVKLPSGKLEIPKPFEVVAGTVPSFVFDITVIAAGNEQRGIKYILLPKITDSGADKPFNEVERGRSKEAEEKAKDKLQLRLEGRPGEPGDQEAVLIVRFRGDPVAGATVTLNGTPAGFTDASGRLTLTLPQDADEVDIKATSGGREGKLEVKLIEARDREPQRHFRGTILTITTGTLNSSPWTMSIPGLGENVMVVVNELEGTPQAGLTARLTGVIEDEVIYVAEAEIEVSAGQLQLRLEGGAQPGASAIVIVTFQGSPVAGATVNINGTRVGGTTDASGRITLTMPQDVGEVKIKATSAGREGELEVKLPREGPRRP